MAAGTSTPSRRANPVVRIFGREMKRSESEWSSYCQRVGRLRTDAPYTFLIQERDRSGHLMAEGVMTAAARRVGGFVAKGRRSVRLPGSEEYGRVLVTSARGRERLDAVYLASVLRTSPGGEVSWGQGVFSARVAQVGAPERELLSGEDWPLVEPLLAAGNARGDIVVAWRSSERGPVYRVRRTGQSRWSATEALGAADRTPGDQLDAVAIDNAGHLHFLINRNATWPMAGLHYRTNATGTWTESLLPGTQCALRQADYCDRALMTYDAVRDRVVTVERHVEQRGDRGAQRDFGVIRIADKRADESGFGPLHEIAVTPLEADPENSHRLVPADLTAFAGQTTLALKRLPPAGARRSSRAGLFVMTGSRPEDLGNLVRVPGTDLGDVTDTSLYGSFAFLVVAASRDRVVLARQRDTRPLSGASLYPPLSAATRWDRRRQGIWLQQRVRDRRTGTWQFLPARHVTASAYDVLHSLALARDGSGVIGYSR